MPLRPPILLIPLLVTLWVFSSASSAAQDLFTVEGRRPDRAVLATMPSLDEDLARIDTAMTRALAGVLVTFDRKAVPHLLRCVINRAPEEDRLPNTVEYYAHLYARDDSASRVIAVADLPGTGDYLAWDPNLARSIDDAVVLLGRRFDRELESAPPFRGTLDAEAFAERTGTEFQMLPPYIEADITMDRRTMKQRLHGGRSERTRPPTARNLINEALYVRLPRDYDPRLPAGLLVWCSAGKSGRIPRTLWPALDELNMICCTASNAGNERAVPDRFQLMFDARANVMRRFHVDARRVYITGISGGGKVTSGLTVCFPDYFRGGVPIVGFNTYERIGDLSPLVARPPHRVLEAARQTPLALITGPGDFNYEEMRTRMTELERDGFERLRLFDLPDLKHEMPTAAQFAEALRWVDAFAEQQRERQGALAVEQLTELQERLADGAPFVTADRAALTAIIDEYPWTEAAWHALERLMNGSPTEGVADPDSQ